MQTGLGGLVINNQDAVKEQEMDLGAKILRTIYLQ